MTFSKTTLNGTVEILASKDFTAIPVNVLDSNEYSNDNVLLAGTPLTFNNEFYPPAGILLYDVYPAQNPNAALIVQGVIDAKKAQAHSGVTYTSQIMAATPGIVFRFNVGAAEEEDADDGEGGEGGGGN